MIYTTVMQGWPVLPMILAFCVAWVLPVDAQAQIERPTQPATSKTLISADRDTIGKCYAVVIGVNDYAAENDLRFAVKDADDFAQGLQEQGCTVFKLTDPDETSFQGIKQTLHAWIGEDGRGGLGSQDTFIIYFSGHGMLVPNRVVKAELPSGVSHVQSESERSSTNRVINVPYLLPSDAKQPDLAGTAINVLDLLEWLRTSPAQHKALIIDACFNGAGKSVGTPGMELSVEPPFSEILSDYSGAGALLMATVWGGTANELESIEHGLFTHYLLASLVDPNADQNLDNGISLWEAHDFVRKRMEFDQKTGSPLAGLFNTPQEPFISYQTVGTADIYLAPPTLLGRSKYSFIVPSGIQSRSGATITIDGVISGDAEDVMKVEGGKHDVAVTPAGSDSPDLKGSVDFIPGELYTLQRLSDELKGARRLFDISGGLTTPTGAAAQKLWGSPQSDLVLRSSYRLTTGSARGVTFTFAAGLSWQSALTGEALAPGAKAREADIPVSEAAWASSSTSQPSISRPTLHAAFEPMWRSNWHDLQWGAGAALRLAYTAPIEGFSAVLDELSLDTGQEVSYGTRGGFATLSAGPLLWQGYGLGTYDHLLLTFHEGAQIYRIDLSGEVVGDETYVTFYAQTGLELGF